MRRTILPCVVGLAIAGCTQTPAHYSYPPPYEAPAAPPQTKPRPAPAYVAPMPPPRNVKPLNAGALTAHSVGAYMDGAERELRAYLKGSGVGVSRPGDQIGLYLRSDVVFQSNSANPSPRSAQIFAAIAAMLIKYDSTTIVVNGYTDTFGAPDRNMQLSRNRADAVANALVAAGVNAHRVTAQGFGQTQLKIPTGANVSEPRNRRVEIIVMPQMKK